jgi:predicted ABC-type ATPase
VELHGALDARDRLLVVLAGPNGAGKSTFFDVYLAPLGLTFVNADLIARTLDPDAAPQLSYAAAEAAERVRAVLLERGESFCMETVFSDPAGEKLAFLRRAREQGYAVILIYVGLESPELCTARVAQRVAAGGHDVPDEKIRTRYPRTLANLRAAVALVDHAYLLDNSSCDRPYRHVATYRGGKVDRRPSCVPPWASALPGLEPAGRRPRAGKPAGQTRPPSRRRRRTGASSPP